MPNDGSSRPESATTSRTSRTEGGRPGRYVLGDEPLPDEVVLLPHSCTAPTEASPGQTGVCNSAATAERERAAPCGSPGRPVTPPDTSASDAMLARIRASEAYQQRG
jgi:hypothetical protein